VQGKSTKWGKGGGKGNFELLILNFELKASVCLKRCGSPSSIASSLAHRSFALAASKAAYSNVAVHPWDAAIGGPATIAAWVDDRMFEIDEMWMPCEQP